MVSGNLSEKDRWQGKRLHVWEEPSDVGDNALKDERSATLKVIEEAARRL